MIDRPISSRKHAIRQGDSEAINFAFVFVDRIPEKAKIAIPVRNLMQNTIREIDAA